MFDTYIGIDWSGAELEYTKSIAIASMDQKSTIVDCVYPLQHRYWSRRLVYQYICELSETHGRALVGIDANLSYAYDVIRQQIDNVNNVVDLWGLVDRYCPDDHNFYAACFWEHPNNQKYFWKSGKKPLHFDSMKRDIEIECHLQKMGSPESPFKLIGAKQVGKGGMAAMRMMYLLRQTLKDKIAFWPFDHKEKIDRAKIVVTEIYPRLFIKKAGFGLSKITDDHQISHVLNFYDAFLFQPGEYSDHQADAIISAAGIKHYLCQNGLTHTHNPRIQIEGWILGVQPNTPFQKE